MTWDARRHMPLLLAALLLIVAASRVLRLAGLELNADEVWTVWQTLGTPQQIVQWTPYDWAPLSYLVVGAWRGVAGMHPIVLRYLTVLIFLPGCAFTYRAMRRLGDGRAALLATLAYAALSYHVFLSVHVRGYAFVIALLPLALWLTLRYFARPTLRRAVPLAVVMALMIYTYSTSVIALAMVALLTLVLYGKAVWRWIVPGVMAALLALPEIAAKAELSISRTQVTRQLVTPPLFEGLADLYRAYTGDLFLLWIVLGAVAVGLIVAWQRPLRPAAWALALWVFGGPLLMYALNPVLGFFSPRYSWWVMLGIALGVGLGLSYLPRDGRQMVAALLLGMMFVPLPLDRYDLLPNPPMADAFQWLRERIRWGDAVVVDPNNLACGESYEWDYYTRLFFPDGLTFATDPDGYRRVWYVVHDSLQDPALDQAVRTGRLPREFFGPPECLFRLYEGPPDAEGILFENGMRFHGMDVLENGQMAVGLTVRREGEPVRVRLWWSAEQPIAFDYSISLQLYGAGSNSIGLPGSLGMQVTPGALLTQVDGPPQVTDAPHETSRWETGRYYLDERELTLPAAMGTGTYPLYLVVYQWWDNVRIPAPGVDGDTRLQLEPVYVKAW